MQVGQLKRREFITLLGGTSAAWSLRASAQQRPVIAYLSVRSAEADRSMLRALRNGLTNLGYVEDQNLAIEYRFADGQYERVPSLVAELIQRKVAVIVFAGVGADIIQATSRQLRESRIPVVFNSGSDPVVYGLAASMNRPGGNFTGVYTLVNSLTGKIFGLLHELLPGARTIATLEDRVFRPDTVTRDAEAAAAALGIRSVLLRAANEGEIETAFAGLQDQRVDAIHVATSPTFVTRAHEIAAAAARYKVPTAYARREFAEAGGLMSYGYDVGDGYRQMGIYAGRILKGDKPGDLPVFQPTKYELVINLKTAKALGLEVPPMLLSRADEVIE